MKLSKSTVTRIAVITCSIVLPAVAFCSAPGTATGSAPHAAHTGPGLGLFWFNFLIYIGAIYLILRKRFASVWKNRRSAIIAALDKNASALKAAKLRLTEARDRHSHLVSDIDSLTSGILRDAAKEGVHIHEVAKARVVRIKNQSKETAQAEEHSARVSTRKALAEEVLRRAEAKLRASHTVEQDKQIRDRGVNGMNALLN